MSRQPPRVDTSEGMDEAVRRRKRTVLLALAALFFLPLGLSFLMYYGGTWRPAARVNHGELIIPARPLPRGSLPVVAGVPADAGAWGGFRGKWSLVYVGEGGCDESCRNALILIRQTRLALNNDMTRVQRVFLATGHCCDTAVEQGHPGLVVVDASAPAAAPLLAAFPPEKASASIFVVDPLGNLMMRYDTAEPPRGLLLDLQKLLRLSHIG
jgi:hypothetical protein